MSEHSPSISTPDASYDEIKISLFEDFADWKKKLLWKIRFVDIGFKIFLILPCFLAAITFWILILKGQAEVSRFIIVSSFFLTVPLIWVFVNLGRHSKSQREEIPRYIDWSDKRFYEISQTLTEAGMNLSTTLGKLQISDRLDVQIYSRSRTYHRPFLILFIAYWFFNVFVFRQLIIAALRSSVETSLGLQPTTNYLLQLAFPLMLIGTFLIIIFYSVIMDVFFPRLTFSITSRTISHLKGQPAKIKLLALHELSHVKHYDPMKKMVWTTYRKVSQIYLVVTVLCVISGIWQHPRSIIPGFFLLLGISVWFVIINKFKQLIFTLQEIRADVEAMKSAGDYQVMLEWLNDMPTKSNFDLDNKEKKLTQMLAQNLLIRLDTNIQKIEEQIELLKDRIGIITTKSLKCINGGLYKKLLIGYGSVLVSLIGLFGLLIPVSTTSAPKVNTADMQPLDTWVRYPLYGTDVALDLPGKPEEIFFDLSTFPQPARNYTLNAKGYVYERENLIFFMTHLQAVEGFTPNLEGAIRGSLDEIKKQKPNGNLEYQIDNRDIENIIVKGMVKYTENTPFEIQGIGKRKGEKIWVLIVLSKRGNPESKSAADRIFKSILIF